MTMITPSYLGETIEYSSLHACRSTLEDPTRLINRLCGDCICGDRGSGLDGFGGNHNRDGVSRPRTVTTYEEYADRGGGRQDHTNNDEDAVAGSIGLNCHRL